jgi:LysR family transcriptional activator of mexEF-oprN operon
MNRNDLRKVDLKLLIVFEMLMVERNSTRASQKLFVTQSAVSFALTKLRALYGDPLFIRDGRNLAPTQRAFEISEILVPALNLVSSAVKRTKEFDPSTSIETFYIGLSDDVAFGLLPIFLRQLRKEAPNILLIVRQTNYLHMSQQLSSGEFSVGVGYTVDLPATAKKKVIRHTKTRLLRADNLPGRLSLDDYCERPHALVSFAGDLNGFVDIELKALGRQRHVVLAVPQFNNLGALLQGTDIVALVPDHTTAALLSAGGLRVEPSPIGAPSFPVCMVWQSAHDKNPAQRWFRSRVQIHLSESRTVID